VAQGVIAATDRGSRFGIALPTDPRAPYAERLLAWAGRSVTHVGHPPIGQQSLR
jgi:hypothetical protein